jgi:hypothetical protein
MNKLSTIKCSNRVFNNFDNNNNKFTCNNFNQNQLEYLKKNNLNLNFYNNYKYSIPYNIKPLKTLKYNNNFKNECSSNNKCSFISIQKNKNYCLGFKKSNLNVQSNLISNYKKKYDKILLNKKNINNNYIPSNIHNYIHNNIHNNKLFEIKDYNLNENDCQNECNNTLNCYDNLFLQAKDKISFYEKIKENYYPFNIKNNNYNIIKINKNLIPAYINNPSLFINIPDELINSFYILLPQKTSFIDISFNENCFLYITSTNHNLNKEFNEYKKLNIKINYENNFLNLYEKKFNKNQNFIMKFNSNYNYFIFISTFDINNSNIQILKRDTLNLNELKYSDIDYNCKYSNNNTCNDINIIEKFTNQDEEEYDKAYINYYNKLSELKPYGKQTLGNNFLNEIFSFIDRMLVFNPKNIINEKYENKYDKEKFLLLFLLFLIILFILFKKILKK